MKAIVFDFDGTLANTLPICYHAFWKVFKKFDNKELSPEEIRAMFGPSETGIINGNLLNSNKEQAIELYYKTYADKHDDFVNCHAEMDGMLKQLRDNNVKLGIVTGKARRSLDISLKALQMENDFDVIITGDDVTEPKPHPEGVIKALTLLGAESNDAMFIGDSDADIQAGKEANVLTAGVQWLQDCQPEEFEIKPDYYFDSVNQFVDFMQI